MVERKSKQAWDIKRGEILKRLAFLDTTISIGSNNLVRLLGVGFPRFYRDILKPKKFVPKIDPVNPRNYLISGQEYTELRNIVGEIKTLK